MTYYLLLLIGLIATLIASITDIKTKEVPDWLNFSLLSIALGIRLIYSLITNYWSYFLYAVIASIILFGIGLSLYYLKQWGGGDVKLLIALGALFAYFQKDKFFMFKFIIALLIAGAIYGLFYSILLAIKNKEKFINQTKILLSKYRNIRKIVLIMLLLTIIFLFIDLNNDIKFIIVMTVITLIIYFYIYILVKAVENICMYRKININDLKEEDWLAEDIKLENKTIKKTIPGITKKHIALLKKSKIKYIKIKEGIPFIPSFFLATIITIVISQLF
jgi:Flp pilus assembly protein protease CpaA